MTANGEVDRATTGIPGLDHLLGGGLPVGSMTILAGPPGSGKTILAQQMSFAAARRGEAVLYMTTLSEPAAKVLRYLRPFGFFDQRLFEEHVHLIDLGRLLRTKGFAATAQFIATELERWKPRLVVIDSFKVFDDLAKSSRELRTFSYAIAVHLLAWEATSVLIGEYGDRDLASNPIFSVSDGLVRLEQSRLAGEPQRLLTLVKMRGSAHSRDSHPFVIDGDGVRLVTTDLMPHLCPAGEDAVVSTETRLQSGIPSLDALLGEGIPEGSAILVAGPPGTGKTVLALQFLHEGCRQFAERGLYFSVQESRSKLLATAGSFRWDLAAEESAGRLEFLCVPHPRISVDRDLLALKERIRSRGARRVVIDAASTLLHPLGAHEARERFYLIANLLREARAVGLLLNETPFGAPATTHFAGEDAVADGVLLLESQRSGRDRQRGIEVVKLRNAAHSLGVFPFRICSSGVEVLPRTEARTGRVRAKRGPGLP